MSGRSKILILDDEQDLLELYQEFLGRLPSNPEIHTATSGARAIALLESEPFSLLLTDLNMPSMDGFQVLAIVRRKFPALRTVVMSSVADEQFRARAYAMGIDLYLEKPKTPQEINMFIDCIESLLGREDLGGFRGVQSKSLVDLIQLECLSQSSSVLRITNGPVEGKIWVQNGDLIDSSIGEMTGEDAFKKILGMKSGNFEILPADPTRTRTIFNSYQGLLLDTAQSMDEAEATSHQPQVDPQTGAPTSPLAALARFKGVEFVLTVLANDGTKMEHWGSENPEQMGAWAQKTTQSFQALGEKLKAGQLNQAECLGPQRHVALVARGDKYLCVGFQRILNVDQIRDTMKQIITKWVS
jgi:CheY-like chemotaxis protein